MMYPPIQLLHANKRERERQSQVLVAHAYNPSYSVGRDQEDHSLKPALVNSSRDPILKKTHHQKGLVE
jgi:hypothetical protein